MRGDVVHVSGRTNRAMALGARLLPRRLTHALLHRSARTFRQV
jgi:hypothetical protein